MRIFEIAGIACKVSPNWSISSRLNQRTTATVTVFDIGELPTIGEGDTLEIYESYDDGPIFSGLVHSVRIYEPMPGLLHYDVSAVDNAALADRRLVAAVAENMTVGDIVRSVIIPILAEEGVSAGTIHDGITVSKSVFNYCYCNDALDQLRDLTGFNWKIDDDKLLHFISRDANIAPFALTDDIPHSGFENNTTMDKYRNRQFVRGSQGETAIQTLEAPTPTPDGSVKSFTVRFPLAKKPVIFVNSLEIPSTDIGINGLDTGKKWYYSYNSNVITQDASETTLINTDALRVTYTGLRQLLLCLEDGAEISDRREKEGTSGIYENISSEATIKTTAQATQYAYGLINKYGEIADTINFTTTAPGLEAGQLIHITKPLFGIDANFLIESVNISGWSPDTIEYDVKALDGTSVGGWEQFFRELVRENRDFTISEDEVVITIHAFTEAEKLTASEEIKVFSCLYPTDTLYASDTLYPNNPVASLYTLYD